MSYGNITEIAERIKKLREDKGVTQLEVSKALHVKRQTVAQWENGERDLKTEAIIELAQYFDVTSDFILGLSKYKTAQAADIGKITGLSDENIKSLQDFHDKETYIYNTISSGDKDLDVSELLKGFTHEARISFNDEGDLKVDTKVGQALNDFIDEVLKSELISYIADCRRSKLYPFNFTSDNVFTTSSELLRYYAEREQFTHNFNKCMDIVKEIIQKCTDYEVYNRSITENAQIVGSTRLDLLFKAREARRKDAKVDSNKEGDT